MFRGRQELAREGHCDLSLVSECEVDSFGERVRGQSERVINQLDSGEVLDGPEAGGHPGEVVHGVQGVSRFEAEGGPDLS